jgi:predicted Zn-dependent protease
MNLTFNEQRQLDAAEGWLGLGDSFEANVELQQIRPEMQGHPFVLKVRWDIYADVENWEMAAEVARGITAVLPDNAWGYIQWAYSLHELKRTQAAKDILLSIVKKFPDEYTISYNLACYCCQLGQLPMGMKWIEKAIDVANAGRNNIRLMALVDRDLEPLWNEISEI